jgi:hypothetical protein
MSSKHIRTAALTVYFDTETKRAHAAYGVTRVSALWIPADTPERELEQVRTMANIVMREATAGGRTFPIMSIIPEDEHLYTVIVRLPIRRGLRI